MALWWRVLPDTGKLGDGWVSKTAYPRRVTNLPELPEERYAMTSHSTVVALRQPDQSYAEIWVTA
jgi:hypothetical protein